MRILIFFLSLNFATLTQAYVNWPSAGLPCNSTLQACVDSASIVNGDTIQIRTNVPIDENISVTKNVSLVAANGYKPVFTAGNSIFLNLNYSSPNTVTIKGLTFEFGGIYINHNQGEVNLNILNNKVETFNEGAIVVDSAAIDDLNLSINYNIVVSSDNGSSPPESGAIVVKNITAIHNITGEIYGNTVTSTDVQSRGISIYNKVGGEMDMNITGNEIYGATLGGIQIHNKSVTVPGTMNIDVTSNAFYTAEDFLSPSGVHVYNNTGTGNINIFNNTMLESRYGILLVESSGDLSANIFNNLIAYSSIGLDIGAGVTVSNNYNLTYENTVNNNYTPGADALNDINPQIIGKKNARLRSTSPAIEAGDTSVLIFAADAASIDADGLLRLKRPVEAGSSFVDIGAYEYGDFFFKHTNTFDDGHVSFIDHPALNGLSTLDSVHITSNWHLNESTGFYNNANEGIYYGAGAWAVFNEGFEDIAVNAGFNIVKFGSSGNTFEHFVNSSEGNFSTINRAGLNGNPDKILQITQHWESTYNDHPPGVVFIDGDWAIKNFDSINIPLGSNFNVYYQDASKSAFEHVASDANLVGASQSTTQIDHPLLNGSPCALVQVTQSGSNAVFNDSPIGVYYGGLTGKWSIYNQDDTAIPVGAAFHVLINPGQIAECTDLIFKNGF